MKKNTAPKKATRKATSVATIKKKSVAAKRAVKPATKRPAHNPASARKTLGGARILVVDDEADIRMSVKTILEKAGYRVDTAQNGDECVAKATPGAYNLILLDIMMPGLPVRDVIERVTHTPIAFLSVVRTSDDERKALLDHPNIKAFIQKPFDIEALVTEVKHLVR